MLALIYGSRPEAIKLGPVAAALRARHVPLRIIATGQHTDLLRGTPAETDLRDSVSLGIPTTGEVVRWPRLVEAPLREALRGCDLVVVQGDTMSAWAGAKAGHTLGIPVAHVEAGIRSGDVNDPWPEEMFRREITQLATWHYAPTERASFHLTMSGVPDSQILVTGNPVVSAMARYADVQPVRVADLVILFTMHRREWQRGGVLGVLRGFESSARAMAEVQILWPIHPGVQRIVPPSWFEGLPPNVRLVPPMTYPATLRLLARSLGVVTDSGGLQEEAATLGVPCAVCRRVTDRPESVEAGIARLFAPTEDGVLEAFRAIRDRVMPRVVQPIFGGVDAADRIAAHLSAIQTQAVRIASTSS